MKERCPLPLSNSTRKSHSSAVKPVKRDFKGNVSKSVQILMKNIKQKIKWLDCLSIAMVHDQKRDFFCSSFKLLIKICLIWLLTAQVVRERKHRMLVLMYSLFSSEQRDNPIAYPLKYTDHERYIIRVSNWNNFIRYWKLDDLLRNKIDKMSCAENPYI